jgi:hypothetical protein
VDSLPRKPQQVNLTFNWEERANRAILNTLSSASEPVSFRELHRKLSTYPDTLARVGSFTTLQHIVRDLSDQALIQVHKSEGITITDTGRGQLEKSSDQTINIQGAFPPNEIIILDIDSRGKVKKNYVFNHEDYEIRKYGSIGMILTKKNVPEAEWSHRLGTGLHSHG